jgi:hypothetical protein
MRVSRFFVLALAFLGLVALTLPSEAQQCPKG